MKKDKGLSNVSLSYSHLTEAKNRIEKKFGSQNYLAYKMAIDWQEIAEDVLYKDRETETKEVEFDGKKYTVPKIERMLNLGAGHNSEKTWFAEAVKTYHSLEPDEKIKSTFKSFEDVPPELKYDFVITQEVIEHIQREEVFDFLKNTCNLVEDNGCLVLTFPNICNPTLYFEHVDHVTSASYGWIAGMIEILGMKVEKAYLTSGGSDSFNEFNYVINQSEALMSIANFLSRFYSLHPAKSVVIVAKK